MLFMLRRTWASRAERRVFCDAMSRVWLAALFAEIESAMPEAATILAFFFKKHPESAFAVAKM